MTPPHLGEKEEAQMCTHRGGLSAGGAGTGGAAGAGAGAATAAGQQTTQQTPAQQMAAVRMQNAQQLIASLKGTTGARYAQFLDPANSDRIVVTIDRVPSRQRGGPASYRVQVDNNTTGVRLWYGYHDTLAQAKNNVYRVTGVDKPSRRRGGSNG